MVEQYLHFGLVPNRRAATAPATPASWPRLARALRGLKLAAALLGAGSQSVPLGDNGGALRELAARVRAGRQIGACTAENDCSARLPRDRPAT